MSYRDVGAALPLAASAGQTPDIGVLEVAGRFAVASLRLLRRF